MGRRKGSVEYSLFHSTNAAFYTPMYNKISILMTLAKRKTHPILAPKG